MALTLAYAKKKLLAFEREARIQGYRLIAGVDEAGRGPLAGPVVAAACILPEKFFHPELNDSKKLTLEQRERLFEVVTQFPHGVGIVSHEVIDQVNIYQATILAMNQAIEKMEPKPDYLLVDGLNLKHAIPSLKIIEGDAKSHSIAAASVIAKVTRDRIMIQYHIQYPEYHFAQHKGYGTTLHREMIAKYGCSPIQRKSFNISA